MDRARFARTRSSSAWAGGVGTRATPPNVETESNLPVEATDA